LPGALALALGNTERWCWNTISKYVIHYRQCSKGIYYYGYVSTASASIQRNGFCVKLLIRAETAIPV
jgi:hypothetical protein